MADGVIGRNTKVLMGERRWQQSDLARRTSLSEASISRILSGEQPNPTTRTLRLLAEAFGCSVGQLLTDTTDPGSLSETQDAILLELSRMLPPHERAKVIEYAEALALKSERDQYLFSVHHENVEKEAGVHKSCLPWCRVGRRAN